MLRFQYAVLQWNGQSENGIETDGGGPLWLLKSYFCLRIFGKMIMQEINQDIGKDVCRVISLFSPWLRLHWRFFRKPVKKWCLTLVSKWNFIFIAHIALAQQGDVLSVCPSFWVISKKQFRYRTLFHKAQWGTLRSGGCSVDFLRPNHTHSTTSYLYLFTKSFG